MTARERYDAMLRESVAPGLRERGFKKRRNRFRRVHDDGWQEVDFQASHWGSRNEVRFTINLRIGVRELADASPDSHVEQRIGSLLAGGEDHWWPLDAETDAAALGDELRRVIDDRCLPWLDARHSLDDLVTLAREAPDEFHRHALGRFRMLLEQSGLDDVASDVARWAVSAPPSASRTPSAAAGGTVTLVWGAVA